MINSLIGMFLLLVPVKQEWKKPRFWVTYGLLGLLCLIGLVKWCVAHSRSRGLIAAAGIVTLEGKPLADAVVTFDPVSKGAVSALGKTDHRGRFDLRTMGLGDGVVPGDYRVAVAKFVTDEKLMDPREAKEYFSHQGKLPPKAKVTSLVPLKFASGETSGLVATVQPRGGKWFQFDLK